MRNIFKKYTFTKTQIDAMHFNSIIDEKFADADFCKLNNTEKEKIIEKLVNQNKEKLNITVKIENQYFFVHLFIHLISKIK